MTGVRFILRGEMRHYHTSADVEDGDGADGTPMEEEKEGEEEWGDGAGDGADEEEAAGGVVGRGARRDDKQE